VAASGVPVRAPLRAAVLLEELPVVDAREVEVRAALHSR
jgi:hypothetical protein